ncbi:MAG: penicillin acylase family protein, partial [Reyranella sp.]|nr:penicillin acylase family protein [Reyranella sp.]
MRLLLRVAAWLGKVLVGTALAVAIFLVGTYFHVRGSLPSYSGQLTVAGLKAPVEILRDKNAVPHIIAGSLEDASFALGYVHAQDRFWQMELLR